MFSKRLWLIVATGLVCVVAAWFYRSHSGLASEADLRAGLIQKIPMGSSKAEVQAYAAKQSWCNPISSAGEFSRIGPGKDFIPNNTLGWEISHYSIRQNVKVIAEFEFDESDRLYDITVSKVAVE
jgi:hypothetical protein